MSDYQYDLIVIGGGSGGVRAARVAAIGGARVALAEQSRLGGTCVNVGCVPKKFFSYAAHFAEGFEQSRGYGFQSEHHFDWPTLRDNTASEIERLNGIYQSLLDKAGVELLPWHARIEGPHEVSVNGKRLTTERILIAVGGKPRQLDFDGASKMVSSNEMFSLDTLPKRLVVYGGGYIAVEFASILNGLGVDTTLVYRGELFLKGFDQELREFLRDEISAKGVKLHFNANIVGIEESEGVHQVSLDDGSTLEAELVLSAVGRDPNFDGLGLDSVDVALDESGFIEVDDAYRTSTPSILALGDVIDTPQLTPVAIAEAIRMVAIHFEQRRPAPINYDAVATAVFCSPNAATVGLTEEQARQRYDGLRIYVSSFRPLMHTLAKDDARCFMKLIVDDASDRVVGVHVAGADAGELVQGLAIGVQAGITKQQYDATIGIHPTSAEEIVTMREVTRR
ncbi:glutathione-disulfide reductase [Carnimonas bestiolae]|uniref:glutathione-disulfide reductase n=1 Tax=Carnimonas bestiolae TaxID=3402172 RepID=UPI003EDC1B81